MSMDTSEAATKALIEFAQVQAEMNTLGDQLREQASAMSSVFEMARWSPHKVTTKEITPSDSLILFEWLASRDDSENVDATENVILDMPTFIKNMKRIRRLQLRREKLADQLKTMGYEHVLRL